MKELFPEVSYTAIETSAAKIDYGRSPEIPDMRVISMSGIISDPERYWSLEHSHRLPRSCSLSEIAQSSGEWTALAVAQQELHREYLYLADPSGFAPVFYSLLPGNACVISDTFSGAVQGVRRLGGNLSLNVAHYLTLISSQETIFQNLVSSETMANEIGVLPYDKALYIANNKVHLIDRDAFSGIKSVTNYDSALDQGINSATKTIERMMSENTSSSFAITLSGGADSRIVFALLTLTGRADEFGLWTIDPRDRKSAYQQRVFTADVEIANEFRERYGLRWVEPFIKEKISVSYEESLALHQGYRSNFAFTYNPVNSISYNFAPAVTLRGGAGEILRGTGGARIMSSRYEKYQETGGEWQGLDWLANEYLEGAILSVDTAGIAHDYLTASIKNHLRPSLRETIDEFYRNTRNRAHFGHIRKSASVNDRLLQVLSNPYLVRATELLTYEEKISARLVRDILGRTLPEVLEIPFESRSTDKQLRGTSPKDFEFRNREGWIAGFDARGRPSKFLGFRPTMAPGDRREEWQFSSRERTSRHIISGFDSISEMATVSDRGILVPQHNEIMRRLDMSSRASHILSAKIASALEVFTPMALDAPGRHFFADTGNGGRIARSSLLYSKSTFLL